MTDGVFFNTAGAVLRALRIHQWVKNSLLFIPLVLAHKTNDLYLLSQVGLAFLAFCLCASGVYVLNDINDLEADRQHPTKCKRPFACGDLSVGFGLVLAALLIGVGIGLALFVNSQFYWYVIAYAGLTLCYSYLVKGIVLADVMILAGLYTIRIVAGAVAAQAAITFWLLAFSLFMFFSLAMVKRYSELAGLKERGLSSISGRGYEVNDTPLILMLGVVSGLMSVLIFALYINESSIVAQYRNPQWLWIITPTLLYWIGRIWLMANRGQVSEDPVLFAIKDKVSYLLGLFCVVSILLAR